MVGFLDPPGQITDLPILNILPIQLYAAKKANTLGIHGFQYLNTIVTTQ
ncbi:MAG: hypothetical protein MUO62_17245 [Anaerolineales bacterium]|nr:hypothetical protein [Anaerolineales bacterium]